jgi:hypothetical protein
MFNQNTYDSSDRPAKEVVAAFLNERGLNPTISATEVFKEGDIRVFIPAWNREIVVDAEFRGTETTNPDKYPWVSDTKPNHAWRFRYTTVHIPGRKAGDCTEIHISIDSKTQLNLTVVLASDVCNPTHLQTASRGADPLTDIPVNKVLIFHREDLNAPWVLCLSCTDIGDEGEADTPSVIRLKEALGLTAVLVG